ncbi:hypothetical protein HDV05_008388, partial [Chytridiales sp. JEL 0842]
MYYLTRHRERLRNLLDAQASLIYSLEMYGTFFPFTSTTQSSENRGVVESGYAKLVQTASTASDRQTSKHHILRTLSMSTDPKDESTHPPLFCGLSSAIYSSNDSQEEYTLAKRYLIHRIYIQVEKNPSSRVPFLRRVQETTHPLVSKVFYLPPPSPLSSLTQRYRTSHLTFNETMEHIDTQTENHVELGYRRLLDVDSQLNPKPVLQGLDHE